MTRKKQSNNTSGYKGVYWDEKRKKWLAHITFKRKKYNLGRFNDIQDAVDARKQAEKELFDPMIEKYREENKNE